MVAHIRTLSSMYVFQPKVTSPLRRSWCHFIRPSIMWYSSNSRSELLKGLIFLEQDKVISILLQISSVNLSLLLTSKHLLITFNSIVFLLLLLITHILVPQRTNIWTFNRTTLLKRSFFESVLRFSSHGKPCNFLPLFGINFQNPKTLEHIIQSTLQYKRSFIR